MEVPRVDGARAEAGDESDAIPAAASTSPGRGAKSAPPWERWHIVSSADEAPRRDAAPDKKPQEPDVVARLRRGSPGASGPALAVTPVGGASAPVNQSSGRTRYVLAAIAAIAAITAAIWAAMAVGPAVVRRGAPVLRSAAGRAGAFVGALFAPGDASTQSLVAAGQPRAGADGSVLSAGPDARVDVSGALSGARWGMTVEDVLAAFPQRAVRVRRSPVHTGEGLIPGATMPRLPVGRSKFTVAFLFDATHRLRAIELRSVDADDARAFDELTAWVSSRHGAPSADEGSAARAASRRARWLTSTSVIDVESTPGKPGSSRVAPLDGSARVVRESGTGARLTYLPREPGIRSPH